MEKIRVFQMGFDIAEGNKTTSEDRESLFNAIDNLINNFYGIDGNKIDFESVGCYNIEDMSHAYGDTELAQINSEN